MSESRITKGYLDRLSTGELEKIADCYGVDIPPGLERIFIIEELLDMAREEDEPEEAGEQPVHAADFPETAELPKQYNITFLEVMIRDPLWAFVFWEVKSHDKEIHEGAPDFGGYCLRVIPLEGNQKNKKEKVFTVFVGMNDKAWYLGFPPAEGRYQVELGVLRGEEEIVLAVSRPFMLPRLLSRPDVKDGDGFLTDIAGVYHNPLARLSGAGDFPVIRNADRLSRTIGNAGVFQPG
jgi:hypothetical protein